MLPIICPSHLLCPLGVADQAALPRAWRSVHCSAIHKAWQGWLHHSSQLTFVIILLCWCAIHNVCGPLLAVLQQGCGHSLAALHRIRYCTNTHHTYVLYSSTHTTSPCTLLTAHTLPHTSPYSSQHTRYLTPHITRHSTHTTSYLTLHTPHSTHTTSHLTSFPPTPAVLLQSFLSSLCCHEWFRSCVEVMKSSHSSVTLLEKLSVVLQKLSKLWYVLYTQNTTSGKVQSRIDFRVHLMAKMLSWQRLCQVECT